MRARLSLLLPLFGATALAACSPNDTSTGNAAASPAAIPAATGSGGAVTQPTSSSATRPGDASLTCAQINDQIAQQNTIVQQANAASTANASAGAGSVGGDQHGSEEDNTPTPAQLRARRLARRAGEDGSTAMAHANALVALGKAKKCFL